MRFSHRIRLTITTSAVAGLALAAVLVGWFYYSRNLQYRNAVSTLDAGLTQVLTDLPENPSKPDLKEAVATYPAVTFGYFDFVGNKLGSAGPLPVFSDIGLHEHLVSGRIVLAMARPARLVVVSDSLDWSVHEGEFRRLGAAFIVLWLIVETLIAAVSWYAADATFRPLHRLTRQAKEISGSDLSVRLRSEDEAEFSLFTEELNALLDRIQSTATREEQFASDAAHELRTPLAIMRAKLETTLLQSRTAENYQEVMASLVPEVDRLSRLVDMLLRSARSGHEEASCLDLSAAVEESAARWLDRFEQSGHHLIVDAEPVGARILPQEVGLVCDNLLDNALRYSPAGTSCHIDVGAADGKANIKVRDEGPGIPDDLIDSVFDRFRRADDSRGRSEGGFGIGLAVCKSIVVARGGRIYAKNLDPGAEFCVELPVCDLPL